MTNPGAERRQQRSIGQVEARANTDVEPDRRRLQAPESAGDAPGAAEQLEEDAVGAVRFREQVVEELSAVPLVT